jgi:hypothetical protein
MHDPALVEMVARAIYFRDGDNTDRLWEMTHAGIAKVYVDAATAALDALAAAGRLVPGWQPIATAPKDGSVILLYWRKDGGDMVQSGWWENAPADRCWYAADNERCRPTHWQPLPAAPRAEDQA